MATEPPTRVGRKDGKTGVSRETMAGTSTQQAGNGKWDAGAGGATTAGRVEPVMLAGGRDTPSPGENLQRTIQQRISRQSCG